MIVRALALNFQSVERHDEIGKRRHEFLSCGGNRSSAVCGRTLIDLKRTGLGKECGDAGGVVAAPSGRISRGEIVHARDRTHCMVQGSTKGNRGAETAPILR